MWHTLKRRLIALGVIALVVSAVHLLNSKSSPIESASEPAPAPANTLADLPPRAAEDSGKFSCDGRVYCSQMTSCEEAKFFLAHCPGTKMDGDGDGIPCEKQFC